MHTAAGFDARPNPPCATGGCASRFGHAAGAVLPARAHQSAIGSGRRTAPTGELVGGGCSSESIWNASEQKQVMGGAAAGGPGWSGAAGAGLVTKTPGGEPFTNPAPFQPTALRTPRCSRPTYRNLSQRFGSTCQRPHNSPLFFAASGLIAACGCGMAWIERARMPWDREFARDNDEGMTTKTNKQGRP